MSDITGVTRSSQQKHHQAKEFNIQPDFSGPESPFLTYRKNAWELFKSLPIPNEKDEAWKRTSLRGLQISNLKLPDSQGSISDIPSELTRPLTDDAHGGQIIMINSKAEVHIDQELSALGVVFCDLQSAQLTHSNLLKTVIKYAKNSHEDKYLALSAALATNGVFLYVPKGVNVEKPLHSLFWTTGSEVVHAFQVFVWLEENSSVTYVLESASSKKSSSQNLHAGMMNVYVGSNAKLNFVELQSYGAEDWNVTHEKVNVDRDGEVDWIFGALGSHLTKNFSDLNLIGTGATGKMSGFYFTSGKQHLDHDTQQNHMATNTTSDLLFKGALVGESRSVWQGMIYVAENATKADGYQANRNLILSNQSRADSIPGLEILTDDVRCTHGATVGRIDSDQVFYLESRGIPRKEAEKLIVEGFFDPIMQRIPFKGVKKRFQSAIEEKMSVY